MTQGVAVGGILGFAVPVHTRERSSPHRRIPRCITRLLRYSGSGVSRFGRRAVACADPIYRSNEFSLSTNLDAGAAPAPRGRARPPRTTSGGPAGSRAVSRSRVVVMSVIFQLYFGQTLETLP